MAPDSDLPPLRDAESPSERTIRASVEALIDRHEGDLIRYGLSLCGDRDLAEDAVQEGFIALVAELRQIGRASCRERV